MESNNTTKSVLAMGRPEHYGEVRQTLTDLESLEPNQYLRLDPGHPAYYEPADIWVRPASDFADPDEVRASIGTHWSRRRFADLFSVQTGERVAWSQSPDGYVAEQLEKLPFTQRENYFQQNVVTRVGGYLLVGRGAWDTVAERVLDGESAFEFISSDEAARRKTAAKNKLLPQIEKHRPAWATPVSADDMNGPIGGEFEVLFQGPNLAGEHDGWDTTVQLSQTIVFSLEGDIVATMPVMPNVLIDNSHLATPDIDYMTSVEAIMKSGTALVQLASDLHWAHTNAAAKGE